MLQIKNLYVNYGQSEVLHGIHLTAQRNETIAIMGRNGMGKTTLFKALIGMLPIKSGSLEVDGKNLTGMESHQRVANGVAFVPQGRMVFPALTVLENIQTGLENAYDKRVPEEI